MRIGVSGASGQMGSLAAMTLAEAEGLSLTALFDAHTSGGISGLTVSQDPAALDGCDVILEFSRPDVVMDHLAIWRTYGANVVVGTSGFNSDRSHELEELWGNGPGNCLVVPNFSIGGVLMMRMAEIAAPHFGAAEVIELHHDRKADAPSGTAIATAEGIARAGGPSQRAVESDEIIAGALGSDVSGVPVHSVRLPGLLAHQMVMFGSEGETLTIRHDTSNRSAFMPGILLAVRSVSGLKETMSFGLEGLLGLV
jgi:4-hydroxy-tetrahydrodipicolinate reductase